MTLKTVAAVCGMMLLGALVGGPVAAQPEQNAFEKWATERGMTVLPPTPAAVETAAESKVTPCTGVDNGPPADERACLLYMRDKKTAAGREAGDLKRDDQCTATGDVAKVVSIDERGGWLTLSVSRLAPGAKVPTIRTVVTPLLKSPPLATVNVRGVLATVQQLDQPLQVQELPRDLAGNRGRGEQIGLGDDDVEAAYAVTIMLGTPFNASNPPVKLCMAEHAGTFEALTDYDAEQRRLAEAQRIADAAAAEERKRQADAAASLARRKARDEAEKKEAARKAALELKRQEAQNNKEETARKLAEKKEEEAVNAQLEASRKQAQQAAEQAAKATRLREKAERDEAAARAKLNAAKAAPKPAAKPAPEEGSGLESKPRPTTVKAGAAPGGTTAVAKVDQGWAAPDTILTATPARVRRAPPPQPREEDYDTERGPR